MSDNESVTKKQLEMNKEKERESSWSDLPLDMLTLIKERLFGRGFYSFGAVCKSWSQINITPRLLPPPTSSSHHALPCLIFNDDSDLDSAKLFHPTYNDFYHIHIPYLGDHAYVESSKDGWLLLSCSSSTLLFYHPSSRTMINLPDIPEAFQFICFASSPTSSDCIIIGLAFFRTGAYVGILRKGEQDWTVHTLEDKPAGRYSECFPIFHAGCFYFLNSKGWLVGYNPEKCTTSWINFGNALEHVYRDCYGHFLCNIDGDLVAVLRPCAPTYEKGLRLFKFDFSKKVWNRIKSIGGKTLYASRSSCFVQEAPLPELSDKVYLPMFFECNGGYNGVFYCIRTEKYYTFMGEIKHAYDHRHPKIKLREMHFGTWIKPSMPIDTDVGGEDLRW